MELRDLYAPNYYKEWVYKNKENQKLYHSKYAKDNAEAFNFRASKWRKRNLDKCAAKAARYRCSKLFRTPKWLTSEQLLQINNIYAEAAILTKQTGIKMSVDHIIPLKGQIISGLHVPENLQIIPFIENCKKSNKINHEK